MSNFNNYGKKMNTGYDLNEEATENDLEDIYVPGENAEVEDSSSDKDGVMKSEEQGHCGEEPAIACQESQDEVPDGNAIGGMARRTPVVGKWGSSFWKDCQPFWDSKNTECNIQVGSDGNYLEDYEGEKDGEEEETHRGQDDVPEDEMLSDEYYEQDGDDQSDSLLVREVSRPSTSSLSLPMKQISTKVNISRSKNMPKYDEYDYEDDDDEDDDGKLV